MARRFLGAWAVTFLLAITVLGGGKAGAQSNALFTPLPNNQLSAPTSAQAGYLSRLQADTTTGPIQLGHVNIDALRADTITIPLPDAGTVEVTRRNTTMRSASDISWSGSLPSGGTVLLVVQNGDVTGSIRDGANLYRVSPLGDGIHALIKVDQTKFPPDHSAPPPRAPLSSNSVPLPAPDPVGPTAVTQVDVLVPYTASAAANAFNNNIAALIQLAIDESNTAYANSNAEVSLRLVGTMEVTGYSENAKSFLTVLCELTNQATSQCSVSNNPQMAAVRARRDQVGADLVSIIVNRNIMSDGSTAGLAWILASANFAFSVVDVGAATGNYTFGHELGHNFGALHDTGEADPNGWAIPWAHGFVNTGAGFRTIMARQASCPSCVRIQRFSNPFITFNGNQTGTTTSHDNARVHRDRVATVAAFRAAVPGAASIIAAVLPNVRTTFHPGGPAVTGFATILNTASVTATQCSISLPNGIPAIFHYQRADAQNNPTGAQDTPVDIGAGQGQTFVFSLAPTAQFSSDIPLQFKCTNSNFAPTTIGVNTLLVSATGSQISDMLSIADTPSEDGITNIPGVNGTGLMVTAAVNIGATATVTCAPTPTPFDQPPRSLAATLSICQTNPSTGACINPLSPGPSSTLTVPTNQTVTFSIFATGQGQPISFDPGLKRIFFLCTQGSTPVGEASVAVRTQ